MRRTLLVVALLLGRAQAAEVPAPFTTADFYRLATVSEPVFSPSGAQLAYTLSKNLEKTNQSTSDLWSVAWSGGKPIPLTRTPDHSEWQPRFSADGRALYFLSDAAKDETTQLWRLPARGGAARQVTRIKGGVQDFDLSPDGKQAVIVAEVGKHVGNDDDIPPPIETERFLFKRDGDGYLDDRTRQLFIVDLQTGGTRQLTSGDRDHWSPSWSPDGQWIAYTGKDRGPTERDSNYEVFVQTPAGGAPRKLSDFIGADNDPDWGARPSWSADSRRLVWLEGGEDRWIYYSSVQLTVADVNTGALTRPARIDRWFYYPRFAPDGSILALVEQDRDTWLARIGMDGSLEYLSSGKRFGYDFSVARDGRIALLETDVNAPSEIFALEGRRQLTHHNAWTAARAQGEVRDVTFRSGDTQIHGYVTLPPGFDATKRYPLLADLHGGPVYQHSHEFNLETRLYAAAGYAVLAVNPRGSSGRGFDFSRAIYADWGNLDAQDISAGISHVIDTGIADPARIGVMGWSYGGILTNYMIASDTRVRAAVSGAGVSNVLGTFGVDQYVREYLFELGAPWENLEIWKRLAYPFLHPERITAPTMFQCAADDDNVPCVGAEQMYQALKVRGVPTRLVVYPGQNHGLDIPSYLVHRVTTTLQWFTRWL